VDDATLIDTSRDPGRTAASRAPTPAHTSPTSTVVRTTVLPRVAFEGEVPRLVSATRERFESARVLGRGGVGEVLLARDNDIDRPVAIKRLLPDFDDPGIVARFVEEIRVHGSLDHPNIVPVHDVGADADGRFYYVMKFVEGETLEEVIEQLAKGDRDYHARFPFERRIEIFRQVLRGVQYAHARGVIHRDLKPANVMVGRYGEVLVMDWGLARRLHEDESKFPVHDASQTLTAPKTTQEPSARMRTIAGSLLGTPAYMSPEQARGDHAHVDERSDIYALCVMFHEFLGLEHYLATKTTVTACILGVQRDEVPFASELTSKHQPIVPADLGHFVRHGVSKNPSERYRSVTEMLDRLQRIEEGHCPVECPATFMKRMSTETAHAVDRRPFVMLGVVATALMLALLGLVLMISSML
jgi:eukaryotic-like serine/threonine-protein kinase